MAVSGRGRRSFKTIGQYSALIALVGVVLLLLNLVSLRLFVRADLTDKNMYTLSRSTKARLKSLDDVVTVKVYYSEKRPPELAGLERATRDILGEFRAHSRGNLQYKFMDPQSNDEARRDVGRLNIPPVSLTIRTKDKLEATNVYIGMGVFYLDKTQAIPVVRDITNLEYDLLSAILRVTSEGDRTVTFLTGHDERDVAGDFKRFHMALENTYRVNTHDTSVGSPVPPDVDTLIVASPKELDERDLFEIDQFLMQGKSLMVLVDPVEIDPKQFQAGVRSHGLGNLLEHYGVKVRANLVEDVHSGFASFTQGYYSYTVPYPLFVKVLPSGMSADHPALKGIESVTMYWPSSLDVVRKSEEGFDIRELLTTSNQAWAQEGSVFNIAPQQSPGTERRTFTLAVAMTGSFKSYFSGKSVPPAEGAAVQESRNVAEATESGKIVVIADSDFLLNQSLQDRQNTGNLILMMNLMDWLTLGEDLISVRSKIGVDRPLKEATDKERATLKLLVTGTVPLLVALFGLLRYWMRRRDQRIYSQLRQQAGASLT